MRPASHAGRAADRWLLVLGLLHAACACGDEQRAGGTPELPALGFGEDAGAGTALDSDHDGLCDDTEAALGTNPNDLDGDHDTLPDLIELVAGLEPTLPDDPAPEEIAYLPGDRGASVDFEVRFTVEGDGQALTGWFSPLATLYRDGDNAEHYFAGSMAVAAAPADAARSVEPAASRFEAVLGRTRLSFSLRFELGSAPDQPCAKAYPFRYAIKSDSGETLTERDYMLIIGEGGGARLTADAFCLPTGCD